MRVIPCCVVLLGLLTVSVANAATRWVSVRSLDGADEVCLEVSGGRFDYARLGTNNEATCTINGPRRIKIISRYLFAESDASRVPYAVTLTVDGREMLRKAFTGKAHDEITVCDQSEPVGSLRKSYVDLPAGRHEIGIRAETSGGGEVAVRVFRQVKRKRDSWMAIAPEAYGAVRHLEFESGNRSTYYHFDATSPLQLSVTGPTSLRVRTRLDFDHTMNGSQTYTLDVLIDDEIWQTFHFDSTKLSSGQYLESPDILPGNRKELRVPVPRGRHTVEIRCVRPDACGVATMIHIPKSDLER